MSGRGALADSGSQELDSGGSGHEEKISHRRLSESCGNAGGATPEYWQARLMIVASAAAVAFAQACEYIFPLGHGWAYDYGAALETIPTHFTLANQHAIGALLAPFVAGGVDRLSFFGSADSPLILSTWL